MFQFSTTKSPIYPFYTGKTSLINNSNKSCIGTCKIATRLLEKDPGDYDNDEKKEFFKYS